MHSSSLLHHTPFMRFWTGQVAFTLAYQMLVVGIGWQIYDLTDSAMSLGLVGLAQFLPQLICTLFAGHVADHYNRHKIVMTARVLMATTVAGLAFCSFEQIITPMLIYAGAALLGVFRAFGGPAAQAMVPNIVSKDQLAVALGWNASAREASTIAGPVLGGFIYMLGADTLYGISAGLFALSFLILLGFKYRGNEISKSPMSLNTLFSGLRFIKGRPVILGSISLDMFAVLLGGATALLPIVAKDILHTGSWGLGVLRAAPAIGAILMSVYLAHFPLRQRVGKIMFASVAVFGLATIVFGLSTNLFVSLGALTVLGAADMISVVIRSTLVQLETPDDMRGRVSAANSLFIGTSNQLGEFESGTTAALIGTVPAIVVGGVGTILIVMLWMRLFPDLTHRDTLHNAS